MPELCLVEALEQTLLALRIVETDVGQMQGELAAFKRHLRTIVHDLNKLIVANGGRDKTLNGRFTESEDEWTCFPADESATVITPIDSASSVTLALPSRSRSRSRSRADPSASIALP